MSAFWRHGYEATSMEDLMDCMGIGRASIYNAFGNKRALFLAALQHYVSNAGALQGVRIPDSPKQAIVSAFEFLIERAMTGESCDGCLVVNTALELAPHDEENRADSEGHLREPGDAVSQLPGTGDGLRRSPAEPGSVAHRADPAGPVHRAAGARPKPAG